MNERTTLELIEEVAEVERLRTELTQEKKSHNVTRDNFTDIVSELEIARVTIGAQNKVGQALTAENAEVLKQRDEARFMCAAIRA